MSVIYQKLSNSGTVNVIGGKNRGDPEKPVSTVCFLCGLRELDTFLQSSLHLKKKTVGFPSRKIRYTVYRTQNCIQSGSFQTGKKTSVITSAVPVLRKNPDVTETVPHYVPEEGVIDNRFRTPFQVGFKSDITFTVPCYRKRDIYRSNPKKMMSKPFSYTVYRTNGKLKFRSTRLVSCFYR